uniref:Arabidopsis retrotransposon Orf1 C-terminal domain-containing protein n=1 Tax=Chenopodium quinoa TaxID=63459 RepID=A0A803N0B8_CHEQI
MSRRNRPRNTDARCRNPSPPPPVDPPKVDTMGIIFNDPTFSNNFLRNSGRRIRPNKFYNEDVAESLGRDTTRTPRRITFQLMNTQQNMTIREVNKAFGWPTNGTIGPKYRPPRRYNASEFWRKIIGLFGYNPRIDKATAIIHPAFRMSQRTIANTTFARGDSSGVVSTRELHFLWHLSEGSTALNVGCWLVDHLEDVARGSGNITIGGMITIIASALNLNFADQEVCPGPT